MTIESIARLAGVGKSTIYRHWGSKAALVQEAIDREVAALNTDVDSGDLSKDLEQLLKNLVSLFASRTGKAFARLIGEAQSSEVILQLVRGHWINHREGPIVSVIVGHSKNAELRDEIDPGCISELMLGIVLLRTLIAEEPLSGEAIEEACRVILQGVARRPKPQQDN